MAQKKCGTENYMNQLSGIETKEAFERWVIQKKIETTTGGQKSLNANGVKIYRIPVVVHIIHNGEAKGVGSNISDKQILSQIEVLNEDFRAKNADSINIPLTFKPLYSDIGFEFVMAKRDPNNKETNGITRIRGSKSSWDLVDNDKLKSYNYWPSENYLNIWVAPLCCSWLGWAQFPQSTKIIDLEPPYNAATDGLVISYNVFGSIAKDPSAKLRANINLGRTTTHEMGHFFGLRHVWGKGGCGTDDNVNDTPKAEASYAGCPVMGAKTTTCGSQDMFMNYMDYVYDKCMHLFTIGQRERMIIIMENSPRKLSLTTSLGLFSPRDNDIALTKIISPASGICTKEVDVILEVQNAGALSLTSTNISLYINDILVAKNNFNIKIATNKIAELTFNSITLNEYGSLNFKAKINSINGIVDKFNDNNIIIKNILRPKTVSRLYEDFTTNNTEWNVQTNRKTSALNKEQAIFYSINNNAIVYNYYHLPSGSDTYISPKLILGKTPKVLLFDYAYAFNNLEDKLSVSISTDCGNTFNEVLFSVKGKQLGTTAPVPIAFYPTKALDWQHVQINLSAYLGQEAVFSFKGVSKGGNRIMLDNIRVVDNLYNDIALVGLSSSSTICNLQQNEVVLWVENKGLVPLNDLSIKTILNNTVTTINYPPLNLLPGKRISVLLPNPVFSKPTKLVVSIPNDDDNSNNNFTQTIALTPNTKQIPLREQFNSNQLSKGWSLATTSLKNNSEWSISNNRLAFIAANSIAKGHANSILLPPLNLANLTSASMHFDVAYAYNGFNEELLRVRISKDCGLTYKTLFVKGGKDLATNFATTSWLPSINSDWKNVYVDLTDYAGNENVLIAIEVVSAQGNNVFIDNIEFYASNILNELKLAENSITAYPSPSANGFVKISFNLTEIQPAKLLIYNAQGDFIIEKKIENALNQTLKIKTIQLQSGLYFARLIGTKVDMSRSFIITN